MKAIKGGHREIAQLLLDLGININLHNFHGDTALHWAVNNLTNNSSLFVMRIFIISLIPHIYKSTNNFTCHILQSRVTPKNHHQLVTKMTHMYIYLYLCVCVNEQIFQFSLSSCSYIELSDILRTMFVSSFNEFDFILIIVTCSVHVDMKMSWENLFTEERMWMPKASLETLLCIWHVAITKMEWSRFCSWCVRSGSLNGVKMNLRKTLVLKHKCIWTMYETTKFKHKTQTLT